ncbi:MAG TPA: ATP-binding protein [Acetivibrio sp.]|uniref:AAA family ATPase n=1 Tax=Acetivibrio sp. TaxID=1872092 RepID=UPI002CEDD859|nr:ATP-binding protein [Acetivibrio sp.]HOM03105.1 ATP-binding protein [Acetivibrio sp.]
MRKFRENVASSAKKCYYLINEGVDFMLIEYRVKNFMSFKNEIVLSMVADNNRELSDTNLFQHESMTLLKSAAIFGSNASGKSNLIESFSFLNNIFSSYADTHKMIANLPYFKLDTESQNKPAFFEISFFLNGKRHRYGIEIDNKGIYSEWLYFVPKRQEACYFERKRNEIVRTGTYFEDKKALDYIKPDVARPFLFTLAQDSIKEFDWAKEIVNYLKFYIRPSNLPEMFFKSMIEEEILKGSESKILSKEEVLSFLKDADIGIAGISVIKKKTDEDEFLRQFIEFIKQKGQSVEAAESNELETYMHHFKYDEQYNIVGEERFPLDVESRGTAKLYALLFPVLFVLKNGGILLVDEIESSLHPLLCERIIRLFNDSKTNPHNAQLIFTTHNTLLMNPKLLRRDQIYFIEKNEYGESTMYSLYDIDLDIRSNFNYLNNYLAGRFGAIPYLGEFNLNI